ncbi:MAG: hypothetical protein MUC47_11255, partial [Candidatus Kapabacteria bacterium]|nr:hypothetical protein [Candidatus Kapabacteria bacterium]
MRVTKESYFGPAFFRTDTSWVGGFMVGCCGGVAALVLLLISAGHAFGQSFLRFTSAPLTRVSPKHISYDGRWAAELIEDRIVVVHDVVNDTIVYRDESLGTRIQDVVMLGSTAVIVDSTGSAIALHQDGSHDTLFLEYSPSSWPMTSIRPYGAKALLFNRRVTVSGGRNLYHDYTTIVFDASLKQHNVYKTYGYTGESRSDIATFDGSSVISIFHQNIEGRASEDDPSLFFTITHPFADSLRLNVNHKESRFPEWRSCIVL